MSTKVEQKTSDTSLQTMKAKIGRKWSFSDLCTFSSQEDVANAFTLVCSTVIVAHEAVLKRIDDLDTRLKTIENKLINKL